MTTFSQLGPLNWQVPIVDSERRPTPEFSRYFAQLFGNDNNLLNTVGDKVNKTTQVIAGVGLTGGGDLSADRTFNLDLTAEAERVRDVVGATLVAGSNVTITVDDTANTITIASSGGGGGGYRPMVSGENPPVFIINVDHDLIMAEI